MKGKTALFLYVIIAILLNIIAFNLVYGYSAYGAPAQFGNATKTTCFIGGDDGIVNCTGNITGNYLFGNGSAITSITANDTAYWGGHSTSDEWLTPSQILDVDKEDIETDLNTFWDIGGDTDTGSSVFNFTNANLTMGYYFGNGSQLTGITMAETDPQVDSVTNGYYCRGDASSYVDCDVAGDNSGDCSAGLVCLGGHTHSQYLTSEVDGSVSNELSSLTCTNAVTSCSGSGTTAYTITGDNSGECAANYFCAGGHTHDGRYYTETELNAGQLNNIYFTETESNTNFVSRNAWTDIDSYPATCPAGTPFIGTIGDTSTCRGVAGDTSPELGGYLDTAGQNIGSTADEIENIYIATNSKIYLGDGQEGEIYYDGTKLVIKI